VSESPATHADRSLIAAMVSVTSGLELAETLRRIVRTAAQLVEAEYAALGVLGPSSGGARAVVDFLHVGMSEAVVEGIGTLPEGRGLLGHVIENPTPLRLDDIGQDPRAFGFPPGHPPMHSFLGVPVRVRGEVYGNLYLTEKRGGRSFTREDEETVLALAAAAGVAIGNARLFERVRARERWQRAVTEIDNAVLAGADAGEVLALVAARSRRLAEAELALVCLPAEGEGLTVEIATASDRAGQPHPLVGAIVPADSIIAEVFDTGHVKVGGVDSIVLGHTSPAARGPIVALPLRTPERVLGTLALIRSEGMAAFPPQALELAEAFATQAAVTLVLAENRLERERLAVFEDRDRIGRDLHDLVIQRLFATGVQLQRAARVEGVPAEAQERIERAVDDLDATVKEIRQTIFALHDGGAAAAPGVRTRVLAEVAAASAALGFTPSVHFTGTVDALIPEPLADHLVAALREGLSNAARHAGAGSVSVAVVVDAAAVELTVADDGVGLPPDGRRSGLVNLGARAAEVGGEFSAGPRPGGGTLLVWRAPLADS